MPDWITVKASELGEYNPYKETESADTKDIQIMLGVDLQDFEYRLLGSEWVLQYSGMQTAAQYHNTNVKAEGCGMPFKPIDVKFHAKPEPILEQISAASY
ncbi:hypothetical protein [Neptuniibacter sp. QD37_11]|uniref:hypothetical protein n=1 Tax=Neptuniibacter sp. QD37_11 TaxID=3398209 RepID=UPI0039F5EC11